MIRLIKKTGVALSYIGTVVGLLYLWPDIQGLPEAYGWTWGHVMPDRETVTFIFLGISLAWILWMDARPFFKDYFSKKIPQAPLIIEHAFWHSPMDGSSISKQHVRIVNVSETETVDDVAVYLDRVRYMAILHSPLSPAVGDYLMFVDGEKSKSLRPGEGGILCYMDAPEGFGMDEVPIEIGPFASKSSTKWGNFKALKFDFIIFTKRYPPLEMTTWIKQLPSEKGTGSTITAGIGEPSNGLKTLDQKPGAKLPAS